MKGLKMTQNKTALQEALREIPKINTPDELSKYMFKHKETVWLALNAAQNYADLPAKIEAMRKQIDTGDLDEEIEAEIVNRTIGSILNIIKEQQK